MPEHRCSDDEPKCVHCATADADNLEALVLDLPCHIELPSLALPLARDGLDLLGVGVSLRRALRRLDAQTAARIREIASERATEHPAQHPNEDCTYDCCGGVSVTVRENGRQLITVFDEWVSPTWAEIQANHKAAKAKAEATFGPLPA
jgi:hypothetical protein